MTNALKHSTIWALALILACTFVVLRFDVTTDITEFLPAGDSQSKAQLVQQVATSELSKRIVITAKPEHPTHTTDVSRKLEQELLNDPFLQKHLTSVAGGPASSGDRQFWELYHPARFGFIADTPQQAKNAASDSSIRQALQSLKERLRQPMSPLITRVAPGDPYMIIPDLFEELGRTKAGNIRLENQRFVTTDGVYAVLFLTTKHPAFNADIQRDVLQHIEQAFQRTNQYFDHSITFEMSGAHRFAVAAKQTMERDIKRITIISVLVLTTLLLLIFRSLRLVALTGIPLVTGVIAGLAATLLVHGRIHGITLAFGAALIGVAVDYAVHLYCHHASGDSQKSPLDAIKTVRPSILMGAATTITGFVALLFTSFRGLQEAAIFAIAGLLAALATTIFVVPYWMSDTSPTTPALDTLLDGSQRLLRMLKDNRWFGSLMLATVIAFIAWSTPQMTLSDSFVDMESGNPQLMKEEQRVRNRVSQFEQSQFILARGSSLEQALQSNDAVYQALKGNPDLEAFSSLHTLLPSVEHQQNVAEAFMTSPALLERFSKIAEELKFSEQAFQPFVKAVSNPRKLEPVTAEKLKGSPLSSLISSHIISLDGGKVGVLTFIHAVNAPKQLRQTIDHIKGAVYLDQQQIFSRFNRIYQRRTAILLSVGLAAILLLMLIRYRSAKKTLVAALPSLLAVGVTIGVLSLRGEPIDLLIITTLLMIFSMGVDYGVFLVDAEQRNDDDSKAAMLSIMIAGISTLMGFGLLSMSSYPLLHRIGLTAAVGILAAIILSPIAISLLYRQN